MRLVSTLLLVLFLSSPLSALTRVSIPGGIYADALPSGAYAVNVSGAVRTHLGETLPSEPLMFLRITEAGGFRVAGSSNITGQVWVLTNGVWALDGRPSHGAQGHEWTSDGRLFVLPPVGAQDSQGLRYYDPSLPADIANYDTTRETVGFVTGSASYSPSTPLAQLLGIQHLFEWTKHGEVAIGQAEGGAVIQYRGRHYLLEPGDTRFIQFHRDGARLAVAISKLAQREAVLIWLDESEILSLPPYVLAPPAPAPAPPAPTPAPPPAPPAPPREQSLPAAACAVLQSERAKLPSSLSALCHENPSACPLGAILNAAAWAAREQGLGVSRKTGGNHTDSPVGKIAIDVLMLKDGTYWDVFVAADDQAGVNCGPSAGTITDPNRGWVAPVQPGGTIPTPPKPEPTPSCSACESALAERTKERDDARREREDLRSDLHNTRNERDAAVRERDELQKTLWELQSKPQPTCTASIFGIKIPCRVIQPQ